MIMGINEVYKKSRFGKKASKISSAEKEVVIEIKRVDKVIKGGRKLSFSALVIVGDQKGSLGLGFGKADSVPLSIRKACRRASKNMKKIHLCRGTIYHEVRHSFGASKVFLKPACKGTGIIAGKTAHAILELAGLEDVLTKSSGSTKNKTNLAKAIFLGLQKMRSPSCVAKSRGISIEKVYHG